MINELNDYSLDIFRGDFESIKEYASDGTEIWRASNLMKLFDYSQWQKFNQVIETAMGTFHGTIIRLYEENGIRVDFGSSSSVSQTLFDVNLHFIPTIRQFITGKGRMQEVPDYYLTKMACYAIAMEADNRKPVVKAAKQYLLYSTLEDDNKFSPFANLE